MKRIPGRFISRGRRIGFLIRRWIKENKVLFFSTLAAIPVLTAVHLIWSRQTEVPWVANRLNRDVPVYWNANHKTVKSSTAAWWLARNKVQWPPPQEILRVEEVSLPTADGQPWEDFHESGYGKCAVVGSSGNLSGSGYGLLIDGFPAVLRVNMAFTAGFEKDVGTKTTVQFLYPIIARDVQKNPGAEKVFFAAQPWDAPWIGRLVRNPAILKEYGRVHVLHPEFVKDIELRWLGNRAAWPSTGFIALIYALRRCQEVNVFGFGANEKGEWDHYYPTSVPPEPIVSGHDLMLEGLILEKLDAIGRIKWHKGNRPAPNWRIIDEKHWNEINGMVTLFE